MDHIHCFQFRDWLNNCGLINLDAVGPRFTWMGQNYRGFGRIYERLDRVVSNAKWRDMSSGATIFNLPKVKLDHHLVLLMIEIDDYTDRPRPLF